LSDSEWLLSIDSAALSVVSANALSVVSANPFVPIWIDRAASINSATRSTVSVNLSIVKKVKAG